MFLLHYMELHVSAEIPKLTVSEFYVHKMADKRIVNLCFLENMTLQRCIRRNANNMYKINLHFLWMFRMMDNLILHYLVHMDYCAHISGDTQFKNG